MPEPPVMAVSAEPSGITKASGICYRKNSGLNAGYAVKKGMEKHKSGSAGQVLFM